MRKHLEKFTPWSPILDVIVLDQFTKWWVVEKIGMGYRPSLILNDYMALVMVWNRGISFGILNHETMYMPYVLTALAVIISAILLRFARRSKLLVERFAYGLVIGGALSNAIDRLRVGAVADFFYVHYGQLGWPAFNFADAMICLGVGLLLIIQLRVAARS
ncbi:MAG: signal peptidase II [Rickettsiales bacterium]